jgi:GPH family glycoside/pentoside/hexuronide:cation symporter
MAATLKAPRERLGSYSLFAAVLAGAGLPIYIYAPKFYADTYGVSLASLAAVLFGLRLFDVIQDPILGWISERLRSARGMAMAGAGALLALSMLGLFAVVPPISPIWWFGLTITGLFSAFSFLTINFYAQGVSKAADIEGGHNRLAAWRETGALLGVCVAAVMPSLLTGLTSAPFAIFAGAFAGVAIIAAAFMAPEWSSHVSHEPTPIKTILSDKRARNLLVLALVNATPLAVSSTLFLFFVESRLGAPGWEGPLLVLFFLAAALSAPFWAKAAEHYGAKSVLLVAMILAVASFATVLGLGEGDIMIFAAICVISGATIGADLTLLPALFARRMADIAPSGAQGFGLWSLVSKFTLAIAAAILLPILQNVGFTSGSTDNPELALTTLTQLYALVPCALKLVAIALLLATPMKE